MPPTPGQPNPRPPNRGLAASVCLSGLCLAAGVGLRVGLPASLPADHLLVGQTRDLSSLLLIAGLVILGRILLCRAQGCTWAGRRPASSPGGSRWTTGAMLLVVLAGTLMFARQVQTTKTAVLEGRRTFWLDDDMMISLRFARNLAGGDGLVWNAGGEKVEGITNLLWTLLMTPAHWILPPRLASAGVLTLSGILVGVVLLLSWRLGGRLGLDQAERLLAVAVVAANRWLLYWSAAGSEAVLLAGLFLAAGLAFLAARRHRPLGWGVGLLLGVTGLVRADAPVAVGVFLLVWWRLIPPGRARRWAWLPAVALPAAAMLWRFAYYGDPFPNTYYLRMVDVPTRLARGANYLEYFMLIAGGLVGLVVLHAAAGRRHVGRWLAAVPIVMLGYAAYCGGDELEEFRFFAPIAPLLIVFGVAGAARVLRLATVRRWSPELRFAWLTLVVATAGFFSLALPDAWSRLGRERAKSERNNVVIGLMLNAHTRPSARIAHVWAGAAPYFSDRPAIDMLGKVDPVIAHRPAPPDDFQVAHNKYDPEHIFGLRPDVLVIGFGGRLPLDRAAFDSAPERQTYAGLFRVLEHPSFWSDYLPGLASDPISMDYHGILVRNDSELADPPDQWTSEGLNR
jgi:hypothetical protein